MSKKDCIIVLSDKNNPEGIIDYDIIENDYDNELIFHLDTGEIFTYNDKTSDECDIKIFTTDITSMNKLLKRKNINIKDLNINKVNINKHSSKNTELLKKFKDQIKVIDFMDLELKDIKKIYDHNNFPDDVKFILKYENSDIIGISKQELENIFNFIDETTNYVKRFNLSPLEQAIFVYDLLKERNYQPQEIEQKEEDKLKIMNNYSVEIFNNGRSLSKVLNSNDIVCAGYSNIYAAILNNLNIVTKVQRYRGIKQSGHASNLIYINDKKYKLHGLFEIDSTFDSGEKGYKHFGKSLTEATDEKREINLIMRDIELIEKIKSRMNNLNKLIELGAPSSILFSSCESVNNNILMFYKEFGDKNKQRKHLQIKKILNEIHENITNKGIHNIHSKEPLINKVVNQINKSYQELFNSTIPIDTFIKASYIAYRTECSIGLIKSNDPFYDYRSKIVSKYLGYNASIESLILSLAFGDNIDDNLIGKLISIPEKIIRISPVKEIESANKNDSKIKVDLARMKLISTLHNIAEDNINTNPIMPKVKKIKK